MSRIETLEAAWPEEPEGVEPEQAPAEPAPEPVESANAAPESAPPEEAAPGRSRDDQGRFAREKPAPKAKSSERTPPAPAAGKAAATVTPPGAVAAPPVQPPAPAIKAPQSWKPAEREAWSKVPPEAQAAIARREREVAMALQQAAESGKGIQPWQEAVRPYEAQIRAAGMEPVAYVGDLLKTAHALTYSAPQQKAGLLADLIMQFGVQPGDLDQALAARMQGQAPQQSAPPQYRDPRVDELMSSLQATRQQRAQALEQDAQRRIQAFSESHEFFDDPVIGNRMAALFDVWAKEGKADIDEHDWELAYNIACMSSPEHAGIIEQRKKAETVRTAAAATERAKAASSSVRSQPTAGNPAPPADRRAVLSQAYDDLVSR